MLITIPDRAVRGHQITVTLGPLQSPADDALGGKTLKLVCEAFESDAAIPTGLTENTDKTITLGKSVRAGSFTVELHANNSKVKDVGTLKVEEPAIGFAAAPTVSKDGVTVTLSLEHSLPLVAVVYITAGCLAEGSPKGATWDSSHSGYKVYLDGSKGRQVELTLPLQAGEQESDRTLKLTAGQNCVIYNAGQHGSIEDIPYFEPEVVIDASDMPAPVLQFTETPITGTATGDEEHPALQIGTVTFNLTLSGPVTEDSTVEITGDVLAESPLAVTIKKGASAPAEAVTGTLLDSGRSGKTPKKGRLILVAKDAFCTIGERDHVDVCAQPPTVSITSDSSPGFTINEDQLLLGDLACKLTLSYLPTGVDPSCTIVCPNLAAPIKRTFTTETGPELDHTFKAYDPNAGDSEGVSHWKEDADWRETRSIDIQESGCQACLPKSDAKGFTILSPIRLNIVGSPTPEKNGIYGAKQPAGFYRGPFIYKDTIQFQVELNRASAKNERFEVRFLLNEDDTDLEELRQTLTIEARKLTTETISVVLEHDRIKDLTEDGKLYATIVSLSGGECPIDPKYHDLMLTEAERNRQIIDVHPMPYVFFDLERAVHFGPDKTVEEGKNEKYDQGDKDSYHYLLVATSQKFLLHLSEPLLQQTAILELTNKKNSPLTVDAVEVRIPPGSTDHITDSIALSGSNLLTNPTRQIAIRPVTACNIFEQSDETGSDESPQSRQGVQGRRGKNQAHLLRLRVTRSDSTRYYFGAGWITPTGGADVEYSESGESVPVLSPHDQVWIQVSRDDPDLAESKNEIYLLSDLFGEDPIPVTFAAKHADYDSDNTKESGKVSAFLCPATKDPKHGLQVRGDCPEGQHKLRIYRRRTWRTGTKLQPSEKKVTIDGESAILTKVIDTQLISVRRRFATFDPGTADQLQAVKPGQENVPITLRLSSPAGPSTWLKLVNSGGAAKKDAYYVNVGLGDIQVEQAVDFKQFGDHSEVAFEIEAYNGAVEIAHELASSTERSRYEELYPSKIESSATTISFRPRRPVEETLFTSDKSYSGTGDEYDDSELIGCVKHNTMLSIRLVLNHALAVNTTRTIRLRSRAFPKLEPAQRAALNKSDTNPDGNVPYPDDPADAFTDETARRERPVLVKYITRVDWTDYDIYIGNPTTTNDQGQEIPLTEIEVKVLVNKSSQVLRSDPNETRGVYLVELSSSRSRRPSDLVLGEHPGFAIEVTDIATVSVGRDQDESDGEPWIIPDQRIFADGDPARIYLTTSEKPSGSNAICSLVSPMIKKDDDEGKVPITIDTSHRENYADITFTIDGIGETKLADWMVRAGRWIRNVWQDHKTRTLFLERELAAVGDDGGAFLGTMNPEIDTTITLLSQRYAVFRRNNHFADDGPYRVYTNDGKQPLDAPPVFIHLSIPAPLGGCKIKVVTGMKARFFTDTAYKALVAVDGASDIPYRPERDGDPEVTDAELAAISLVEAGDKKSAEVTIPEGKSLAVIRVAFIEDSLSSGGTVKLEPVDGGYCTIHKTRSDGTSRNITLKAMFGEPAVRDVEPDPKRVPQLGRYAVLRVKLDHPAPRAAACTVKANPPYWDETPVRFTVGDDIGKALVLIKAQPTTQECTDGLDIELTNPVNIKLGSATFKKAKALKVADPERLKIVAVSYIDATTTQMTLTADDVKVDGKAKALSATPKSKHKKLTSGDRIRLHLARAGDDTTNDLNFTIRSPSCGAVVSNGTIPAGKKDITRDLTLTVADEKTAHPINIHKPGAPALSILIEDQLDKVTLKVAAPPSKPQQNEQECEYVKQLREKEARESGHKLLEPKAIPLNQPCFLQQFTLTVNYGDITVKDRTATADRTFVITQDPMKAKEENTLICTEETVPIIQVISGPPDHQLFTAAVKKTTKYKLFSPNKTTTSVTPDDLHFKGLTINPNPLDGSDQPLNHFCEDSFDFSACTDVHNHPILTVLERQMPLETWEEERKTIKEVYELSILRNELEYKEAVDSQTTKEAQRLTIVRQKLRDRRSDLERKDDQLNDNYSARVLKKPPFAATSPFPDKDGAFGSSAGEGSLKRRQDPNPGKRDNWEYLRPVPAANGLRSAMGGIEICRSVSFPIYQPFLPWGVRKKNKDFGYDQNGRQLEMIPPHQYLISLNACGKPDPMDLEHSNTVSKLQAVVEVYPSDEIFFMIGVGSPPDHKIHHIGAEGTFFDPEKGFDPKKGFDSEFKKGLKSVSQRGDVSQAPDLLEGKDGRKLEIKPFEAVPTMPDPAITLEEFKALGETAKTVRDGGGGPPIASSSSGGNLLDQANFYKITTEVAEKNRNIDKVDSPFIFYNYDDTSMTSGRRDIEFSKTSSDDPDGDSLRGFSEAWNSANVFGDGDGLWENSGGGESNEEWYGSGLWATGFVPRVFVGRNGQPERVAGPVCQVVNVMSTVAAYVVRIASYAGSADKDIYSQPVMGFGFNVKFKFLQGEYMRYEGWKEASDHRVFHWKYQNINMTLADMTIEFMAGFGFSSFGLSVQFVFYAYIRGACNLRTTWETEPPTLPLKERQDWNKSKDSHVDLDFEIGGGIRCELASEYLFALKGQISGKLRFRFDIMNEFRYSRYNGGVTALIEMKFCTKSHEKEWILWRPDPLEAPSGQKVGGPFSDPHSMSELSALLSRIGDTIRMAHQDYDGYLKQFQQLQLQMFAAGNRQLLTDQLPMYKGVDDGSDWDHNKRLWDQQWKEVKAAFSAEKRKVRGRNSLRRYVLSERLQNKTELIEDFFQNEVQPRVERLRDVEAKFKPLNEELGQALEDFDKLDQPNRKRLHVKADKLLADANRCTLRRQIRQASSWQGIEGIMEDLHFYALKRKAW